MDKTTYRYRLLARLTVEATTPLAVGSGEKGIVADSLVATDVNGLPCLPATSIAGVLRHAVGEDAAKAFFGNPGEEGKQGRSGRGTKDGKNTMTGSRIIFTEAKLVGKDGKPVDGLAEVGKDDGFLGRYLHLPIRQHNSIDEYGSVRDKVLFSEQIVYKGSRFCFEMEMLSETLENDLFGEALKKIGAASFRLGSGTACGFGELRVVACQTKSLDMRNPEHLMFYAGKSSDLSAHWEGTAGKTASDEKNEATVYTLRLKPADFFLFGSGFGDDEADMTPVKESVVTWPHGEGQFSDQLALIPATSVKGAIAHRTAYHYNKKKGYCTGNENAKAGVENLAVRELFGYADNNGESRRGNVCISDVHLSNGTRDKVAPHVAIDRFTGGTIDGALFSEKTVYGNGQEITLTVSVAKREYSDTVVEALEQTLADICNGLLPLGGGVNRGNGVFKGNWNKTEK